LNEYDYYVQLGKQDMMKALSFIPANSGKKARVALTEEGVRVSEPECEVDNAVLLKTLASAGQANLVFSRDFLANTISAVATESVAIVGHSSDKKSVYLRGEDDNAYVVIYLVAARSDK
jgi:hypothetical protein